MWKSADLEKYHTVSKVSRKTLFFIAFSIEKIGFPAGVDNFSIAENSIKSSILRVFNLARGENVGIFRVFHSAR